MVEVPQDQQNQQQSSMTMAEEKKRWICIYPSYLNSKKTLAEGRKIAKDKAVDNPTCQEISDILKNGGFNVEIEKKMYPRDSTRDYTFNGRVRVQLNRADGSPVNAELSTRVSLMLYTASMIPKLKGRLQKSAQSSAAGERESGTTTGAGQKPTGQQKKKKGK